MRSTIDLVNALMNESEASVQFREHRGALADSMKTLKTFSSHKEFTDHIFNRVRFLNPTVDRHNLDINIQPYSGPDDRIGWPMTYLVLVDGVPFGFTDKMFPENLQ